MDRRGRNLGGVYVVVLVVALVVIIATYLTWLGMRIDRLGARVRDARASLDVQLERRADGAREAAERAGPQAAPVRQAALSALAARSDECEVAESGLTRALRSTPLGPDDELSTEVARVSLARQFHNDAVRDLRTLRGRWLVRSLRLGGRSPLPAYFEIDDDVTLPTAPYSGPGPGAGPGPGSGTAEARPGQPTHT